MFDAFVVPSSRLKLYGQKAKGQKATKMSPQTKDHADIRPPGQKVTRFFLLYKYCINYIEPEPQVTILSTAS